MHQDPSFGLNGWMLFSSFGFFSFFSFFLFAGKKMSEERALAVAVVIPCEEER
jgi:hypothetical protein